MNDNRLLGNLHKHLYSLAGEASSNTYTGVLAFVRGPTYPRRTSSTLAQYLYEAAPFARYIVLMRDPVDRCVLCVLKRVYIFGTFDLACCCCQSLTILHIINLVLFTHPWIAGIILPTTTTGTGSVVMPAL